jgi:hypothetical protein
MCLFRLTFDRCEKRAQIFLLKLRPHVSTKMFVKKRLKKRYCPLVAQILKAPKTGIFPNGKWLKEVANQSKLLAQN